MSLTRSPLSHPGGARSKREVRTDNIQWLLHSLRSILDQKLVDWMIDWFVHLIHLLILWCLTPFSILFQLHRSGQCSYPCFPGVLFPSASHSILSKPLAAFRNNHRLNNGERWARSESCRNEDPHFRERMLTEPGIEPATSCSQVLHATDLAISTKKPNKGNRSFYALSNP